MGKDPGTGTSAALKTRRLLAKLYSPAVLISHCAPISGARRAQAEMAALAPQQAALDDKSRRTTQMCRADVRPMADQSPTLFRHTVGVKSGSA